MDTDERLQLLINVEHSLKSPLLAALRTCQKSLERENPTREDMVLVRALCNRAYAHLSTFRTFTTVASGEPIRVQLTPISVQEIAQILKTTAEDAQALERDRKKKRFVIRVNGDLEATVETDVSLLRLAIGNIFDNATKYSYPDSQVQVGVETRDDDVAISINSRGLPVGREDVDRIFERGYRAKLAALASGEGSGLGLWLVANAMKALSGTVIFQSGAENTSVFTLKLPRKATQ